MRTTCSHAALGLARDILWEVTGRRETWRAGRQKPSQVRPSFDGVAVRADLAGNADVMNGVGHFACSFDREEFEYCAGRFLPGQGDSQIGPGDEGCHRPQKKLHQAPAGLQFGHNGRSAMSRPSTISATPSSEEKPQTLMIR